MSIEKQEKIIKKEEDSEMLEEKWLSKETIERIVKEKLLDIFSGPEKNRLRGKDPRISSTGRLSPFVVHGTHFENIPSILKFGFNKFKRIRQSDIAGDFSEDEDRTYFNPVCKNGLKLTKFDYEKWLNYFPVYLFINLLPLEEQNREDFLRKYREEEEQEKIKFKGIEKGEAGDSYEGLIPRELVRAIMLNTNRKDFITKDLLQMIILEQKQLFETPEEIILIYNSEGDLIWPKTILHKKIEEKLKISEIPKCEIQIKVDNDF